MNARRIHELRERALWETRPDVLAAIQTELGELIRDEIRTRPPPDRVQVSMDFDGRTFDAAVDAPRLGAQLTRVHQALLAASFLGEWLTLGQIRERTKDPEASISARVRDLRKPRFGGHVIERRRRGDPKAGVWEYRMGRE